MKNVIGLIFGVCLALCFLLLIGILVTPDLLPKWKAFFSHSALASGALVLTFGAFDVMFDRLNRKR